MMRRECNKTDCSKCENEDECLLEFIKERELNDDGVRYTLEEVKNNILNKR